MWYEWTKTVAPHLSCGFIYRLMQWIFTFVIGNEVKTIA